MEHAAEGISDHVCQTMCRAHREYTVGALCISVTVSVCGCV